jgi:DNA-binding SARP family transcriptional activator
MTFEAKTLVPLQKRPDAIVPLGGFRRLEGSYAIAAPAQHMPLSWPGLEHIGWASVVVLSAPWDFLMLGRLAALLRQRYADLIWVRLTAQDDDPGQLLLTLLGALTRFRTVPSAEVWRTVTHWARRGEWRRAYQLLGEVLSAAAVRPTALVLEDTEHLDSSRSPLFGLLVRSLKSAAQDGLDIILAGCVQQRSWPLSVDGVVLGPEQLRLDQQAAERGAAAAGLELTPAILDRIVTVTGGAGAALEAMFSAGTALGSAALVEAITSASGRQELFADLCGRLLADTDDYTCTALATATRLGLWHPAIAACPGRQTIAARDLPQPGSPWWLNLADGWRQVIHAWRVPLRSANRGLDPAELTVIGDHLAREGAAEQALFLYQEAHAADRVADAAVRVAGGLASVGSWAALAQLGEQIARASPATILDPAGAEDLDDQPSGWRRLPRRILRTSPWRRQKPPPHREMAARAPTGSVAADAPELQPGATVHVLGELRVAFGDRRVETWASGRGRAVFEYLVVHRHSRVRRDRLMAVFWPESSADAARNSLNVAIHGLRQTLRTAAGDRPIVICKECAYFIEPDLGVWVDVEAFEERLKSAEQYLSNDEAAQAQTHFEMAVSLYQGDFLADDPYESWGIETREHLRLRYLDALDQLARLRFSAGDYVGCAESCLKILSYDTCREDAHCLLMRCHSRRGQPQLALRQYHSCVTALHQELQLLPAPSTTELFCQIRRRESV